MNKKGHTASLVPAHPGNSNAVRHGAFSKSATAKRAAQIHEDLQTVFGAGPELAFPMKEVAALSSIVERIDLALEESLLDRRGKVSYLLPMRRSLSRQLERWYETLKNQAAANGSTRPRPQLKGEQADYVAALQAVAFGHEPRATVNDQ